MKTDFTDTSINQHTPPKLAVNVTEMAAMLSISRPFAYQIINREDFRGSSRVGNKRLVSVDALREWIKNQVDSENGVNQ